MRIAVTGSIATDHLMVFPGRFTDQLIAEQLDKVSLSFLADSLEIRRGGVAANIAVGLGRLGLGPVLAGAVGGDFADYRAWLHDNGVDTELVHVSESLHTARFVCTTDADQNQIATFYAGAMAEAKEITLAATARRVGGLDLVVVAPNDPEAMRHHTDECRRLGIDFAADPSQQLARLDGQETRRLVDGARFLFTNAYEAALLQKQSGWSEEGVLERVGTWVTTLGPDGVVIARAGRPALRIPAVPTTDPVDPTGVGDAFRAGFLAGTAWDWSYERAAQLGCALATTVLESVGTQEYKLSVPDLLHRIGATYGPEAAREIEPRLTAVPA
ncbi:carbohydrate kinase family protein [Streptomyces sp. NBC_01022]|uniref:carbohydrate kinase family protein n=1 Tax=Streptomyces sp. NBC_01022 TaxID=2903723 RepID=UPI002DDB3E02|nr:carbohydrate kinase family protein [Streptomyces sp. NBC_01022]WRZ87535.1 carbohydrate kinase family protein [Streptomyces sp. NBC_01022]